MTDSVDALRSLIEDMLKEAGLRRGRGSVWRVMGPEVQWAVHIDRRPYGRRLALEVGLDLQVESPSRRVTACPIVVNLEFMPFARELSIFEALDLDSGMDPEARRAEIAHAIHALRQYVDEHLTIAQVRSAYRIGDLRSALIFKDTRLFLEGERTAP